MKKLRKILAIIGIIVIAFIALVFFTTSGVPKAAEDIMAQFHNGEVQQVYENSMLSKKMSFEDFSTAMGIGDRFDISKATKLNWMGRGFENNEKYIYGDFEFADGTVQTLTFWFFKIDNTLVLNGITPGAPE